MLEDVPRYHTSVVTPRSPDDAFDYMAAFDNVAEWDPGVKGADPVDDGPARLGSRFRVMVSVAGLTMPLEYRIVEFDPPRRVRLVAQNRVLRSCDEVTVEPATQGTTVIYDADLQLLGPLRVFHPAMEVVFGRIGDRAAAGLRRKLRT